LMPCNVVVYEADDGTARVRAIDPMLTSRHARTASSRIWHTKFGRSSNARCPVWRHSDISKRRFRRPRRMPGFPLLPIRRLPNRCLSHQREPLHIDGLRRRDGSNALRAMSVGANPFVTPAAPTRRGEHHGHSYFVPGRQESRCRPRHPL
jgi:hypothetical protein